MTLNIGVRVRVLEKYGDGWWKVSTSVENENKELVGLYPSNYLLEDATKQVSSHATHTNNNTNLLNGCFGLSHGNAIKNEVYFYFFLRQT